MKKLSISIPKPSKVGSTAVKTPKAKKLPGAMDKPSVFFKSEMEEFPEVKHPNLAKLKKFLLNKREKKQP